MKHLFRALVMAALCTWALGGGSLVRAEEAAHQHGDTKQAAPADKPADTGGAAGCPYAEAQGGACCGACKEKLQQGKPMAEAEMDCPCKRAAKQAQPET